MANQEFDVYRDEKSISWESGCVKLRVIFKRETWWVCQIFDGPQGPLIDEGVGESASASMKAPQWYSANRGMPHFGDVPFTRPTSARPFLPKPHYATPKRGLFYVVSLYTKVSRDPGWDKPTESLRVDLLEAIGQVEELFRLRVEETKRYGAESTIIKGLGPMSDLPAPTQDDIARAALFLKKARTYAKKIKTKTKLKGAAKDGGKHSPTGREIPSRENTPRGRSAGARSFKAPKARAIRSKSKL